MNDTEFITLSRWWREPSRRELLAAKKRAVAWAVWGWLAAGLLGSINLYLLFR
jgi:hypothetical protein